MGDRPPTGLSSSPNGLAASDTSDATRRGRRSPSPLPTRREHAAVSVLAGLALSAAGVALAVTLDTRRRQPPVRYGGEEHVWSFPALPALPAAGAAVTLARFSLHTVLRRR